MEQQQQQEYEPEEPQEYHTQPENPPAFSFSDVGLKDMTLEQLVQENKNGILQCMSAPTCGFTTLVNERIQAEVSAKNVQDLTERQVSFRNAYFALINLVLYCTFQSYIYNVSTPGRKFNHLKVAVSNRLRLFNKVRWQSLMNQQTRDEHGIHFSPLDVLNKQNIGFHFEIDHEENRKEDDGYFNVVVTFVNVGPNPSYPDREHALNLLYY